MNLRVIINTIAIICSYNYRHYYAVIREYLVGDISAKSKTIFMYLVKISIGLTFHFSALCEISCYIQPFYKAISLDILSSACHKST